MRVRMREACASANIAGTKPGKDEEGKRSPQKLMWSPGPNGRGQLVSPPHQDPWSCRTECEEITEPDVQDYDTLRHPHRSKCAAGPDNRAYKVSANMLRRNPEGNVVPHTYASAFRCTENTIFSTSSPSDQAQCARKVFPPPIKRIQ